jgi:hypothetical protein
MYGLLARCHAAAVQRWTCGCAHPRQDPARGFRLGEHSSRLRPGERRPTGGSWPILTPQLSLLVDKGNPDPGRVYWARYENARNQTWETGNPRDRSARLDIRRVRWGRLNEWREQRRRTEAGKQGAQWERKALADLRAGMTDEEREDADEGS